jgi:hypothetical protein
MNLKSVKLLDAMRDRRESATPGPWFIDTRLTFGFREFKSQPDGAGIFYEKIFRQKDSHTQQFIAETHTDRKENAAFIAASRMEHEKLEKALRVAIKQLSYIAKSAPGDEQFIENENRLAGQLALKDIEEILK